MWELFGEPQEAGFSSVKFRVYLVRRIFRQENTDVRCRFATGMMMKMGYTASRDERHEADGLSGALSPRLTLAQGVPRRG